MGTISSALYLTAGALDADQAALSVVANNVANASTTGYTKEIPTWKENAPLTIGGTPVGDGATMTGASSLRDRILQERLDQQQQLESASSTRLSALDEIQSLFTINTGSSTSSSSGDIGSDITSFFSSFSSLESSPTNASYRKAVLSDASMLASDISGAASSLTEQKAALDQEASGVASQVNALTSVIAQLNQQIQATSPDSDAGTLEDQRQADISALSKLIGINQVTTDDNGLEITTTSGRVLVDGNTSKELTTGIAGGVTHYFIGTADITTELASGGGALGGYLMARDTDIPDTLSALDQLAYNITTKVNSLNNAGTDLNGNFGGNIFDEPASASGSALAMSVVMTDPNDIAAASSGEGTGDGSNATKLAELADSAFVSGKTPSNYYSNVLSDLGSKVSEVKAENTAQSASVSQLQTQINSLSSVNLNEEASALTTMERSYQAASQTFAILNEIMATALNLGQQTAVS